MSIALLLEIIKAMPMLIKVIFEVWLLIKKITHNKPEVLLYEINDLLERTRNAETDEDRREIANRISSMWAGVRTQ